MHNTKTGGNSRSSQFHIKLEFVSEFSVECAVLYIVSKKSISVYFCSQSMPFSICTHDFQPVYSCLQSSCLLPLYARTHFAHTRRQCYC